MRRNHSKGVSRRRRKKGHDYSRGGYFITIRTYGGVSRFGDVIEGRTCLNDTGRIVAEEWNRTGCLREGVTLDTFMVMPNHVHGLLWIGGTPKGYHEARLKRESRDVVESRDVRGSRDVREPRDASRGSQGLQRRKKGTLSTVVGAFKAAVTRRARREIGLDETLWQTSFRDEIVWDHRALRNFRRYIRTNPQRWAR